MTTKTIPWIRYSEAVDRQIAQHTTREKIDACAREDDPARPRTINGAQTYRDAGSDERYTVGYGGERTYSRPAAPARDYTPSDAQIRFLNGLLVEREHNYTDAQIAEGRADWRKIRPMLDELKVSARRDSRARKAVETVAPAKPVRARLDFSAILDGNYALRGEGDEIKFYRVNTGKNGFKNVQVRASDDLYSVNWKAGIAIMHKIVEAGLEESRMLFATELKRCWKCYKSLTDETSRARGMGDDCASK